MSGIKSLSTYEIQSIHQYIRKGLTHPIVSDITKHNQIRTQKAAITLKEIQSKIKNKI